MGTKSSSLASPATISPSQSQSSHPAATHSQSGPARQVDHQPVMCPRGIFRRCRHHSCSEGCSGSGSSGGGGRAGGATGTVAEAMLDIGDGATGPEEGESVWLPDPPPVPPPTIEISDTDPLLIRSSERLEARPVAYFLPPLPPDDEKADSGGSGSRSRYTDRYLEELETPPPIPPRATRPTNPNAGASASYPTTPRPKSDVDFDLVSSSANSIAVGSSANAPINRLNSDELDSENPARGIRIYPVVKNGVKVSDTHYWLIHPPTHRTRRHNSARGGGGGIPAPSASPTAVAGSSAASVPTADREMYVNMKENSNVYGPAPGSSPPAPVPALTDTLSTTDPRLRRGRSENSKEYLWNMQRGAVLRLQRQIPAATEQECHVVLIGTNWNFDEASHRLKVELLCRTGYASRQHSSFLLTANNWDLEAATREAEKEHRHWLALR